MGNQRQIRRTHNQTMAPKTITLTAEEMEKRIAFASRALSRKKFTEKQLKSYIVGGKIPGASKRTKSGYQLYLDEFRKDLSKEERANVGQVAKDGAAAWKQMDEDEKAPFLEKAAKLREAAHGDEPVKEKKPKGRPKKVKSPVADSDEEPKTPPKPKKSKKAKTPVSEDEAQDESKTPPKPKKSKKAKTPVSDESDEVPVADEVAE